MTAKRCALICWGVLFTLLVACAEKEVRRADHLRTSGFLRDYSILREGGPDEMARHYPNPTTDWSAYRKIILDPIVLSRPSQEQLEFRAESQDLERLATFFYNALHAALSKDYEMVRRPGPDVFRLQVALTSVEESWVVFDVITTLPPTVFLAEGLGYLTGRPLFTGGTSIEYKIIDAQSGELLAAGADRRVGNKTLGADTFDNWSDAEAALLHYAHDATYHLCLLRGSADCPAPKH